MASVDIRGGFGTQLLSMIGALCYYGKENVHEFAINVGGYSPEYRALAVIDTLNIQSIFRNSVLDMIPMKFVDGTEKFSIFREPHLSSFISEARSILPRFGTTISSGTVGIFLNGEVIIHRRTRDRQLLTANQYVDLINLATREYSASPIVIDDKGDFLEDVNSTKDDWLRIARARAVFGAYSTFTLSAAILNPDLELRIVDPRQYLGPDLLGPVDIESIEKIANAFENINWKRLY